MWSVEYIMSITPPPAKKRLRQTKSLDSNSLKHLKQEQLEDVIFELLKFDRLPLQDLQ